MTAWHAVPIENSSRCLGGENCWFFDITNVRIALSAEHVFRGLVAPMTWYVLQRNYSATDLLREVFFAVCFAESFCSLRLICPVRLIEYCSALA